MRRAAAFLGLALAACGSASAEGPGAQHPTAANGEELICEEETVTGSAIPRRVCRTESQVEADRKGAVDMISGPHATPSQGPRPEGR